MGVRAGYPQTGELCPSARWKETPGEEDHQVQVTRDACASPFHPGDRQANSDEDKHQLRRHGARSIWTWVRGRTSERDAEGQASRVTGSLKHTGKQVRTQKAPARARFDLRILLDNLPAMTGYRAAQGNIRSGNAASLDQVGYMAAGVHLWTAPPPRRNVR